MFRTLMRKTRTDVPSRIVYSSRKCSSTQSELLEVKEEKDNNIFISFERTRDVQKFTKHFVEDFFLGIVNPHSLEYPEIETIEETDALNNHRKLTDSLMLHQIDYKAIESAGRITKEVTELLKDQHLLGMKLGFKEDKGLMYLESESSYIQESLATNPSLCKTVAEYESSGYELINRHGTPEQRNELTEKILDGECIACLAHLEKGSWISSEPITTKAVKLDDENYTITGNKSLVYNADSSNLLIVSACVGDNPNEYSMFLVDKNSKGVTVKNSLDMIGLKGLHISDIVFENVVVPEKQLLGNLNEGSAIVKKLMERGKLSHGVSCIGLMRKMINDAINHCIYSYYFQKPLYTYPLTQGIIGLVSNRLFSAESMHYLMVGMADSFLGCDLTLDSIICKIYCSESLNLIIHDCMNLIGVERCTGNAFIERILKDCFYFSAFDECNGYLKLYLAKRGVKYLMNQMANPTVSGYKPKSKWKLYKFKKDNSIISRHRVKKGTTKGFLHLTLQQESLELEICAMQLNHLAELLIEKYGDQLLEKHWELSCLADMAIYIYQMVAVLGRASRSFCIGVRNSEEDVLIARNVTQNAYQEFETISTSIFNSLKTGPDYEKVGKIYLNGAKYPPIFIDSK